MVLHGPTGRKTESRQQSSRAFPGFLENHGKSMKIISSQNLLQSIKQAGVQNSPKWDLRN